MVGLFALGQAKYGFLMFLSQIGVFFFSLASYPVSIYFLIGVDLGGSFDCAQYFEWSPLIGGWSSYGSDM